LLQMKKSAERQCRGGLRHECPSSYEVERVVLNALTVAAPPPGFSRFKEVLAPGGERASS
jgi:hypothetical protein